MEQLHSNERLASFLLFSFELSKEPTAPLPGVAINVRMATNAVRMLHAGCQCSG